MSDNKTILGKQLDEYRLDALLGQGGMARVYRALDVNLQRFAAIKVIDVAFRDDSDYATRFQREAQAIAQLNHPHIVQVYRYGQVDDVLYMAMAYIEGEDLQKILLTYETDGVLMPIEEVKTIMRQICLALDYVHEKGTIHRDIKPSNIMRTPDGRSILTDFGLALLNEIGTQGEIFGTPQYMAPEQVISSSGAIPQSDLYAMGVILYRMMTGVLPFDSEDVLAIAMQHMSQEPTPPSQIQPAITPQLEAVILKALAKEPEQRYQTGHAFVDALEDALDKLPPPLLGSETVLMPPPLPIAQPIPSATNDTPSNGQTTWQTLVQTYPILTYLLLGGIGGGLLFVLALFAFSSANGTEEGALTPTSSVIIETTTENSTAESLVEIETPTPEPSLPTVTAVSPATTSEPIVPPTPEPFLFWMPAVYKDAPNR